MHVNFQVSVCVCVHTGAVAGRAALLAPGDAGGPGPAALLQDLDGAGRVDGRWDDLHGWGDEDLITNPQTSAPTLSDIIANTQRDTGLLRSGLTMAHTQCLDSDFSARSRKIIKSLGLFQCRNPKGVRV